MTIENFKNDKQQIEQNSTNLQFQGSPQLLEFWGKKKSSEIMKTSQLNRISDHQEIIILKEMIPKTVKSVPSSTVGTNPEAAKRSQNLERIKSSLKSVPLFKKNIILNKDRLSSQTSGSSTIQELDLSPSRSPLSPKKHMGKVETVQLFELKYELLEKIGQGSNGLVRKCKNKETGQFFAVKSFTFEEQHLPGVKSNFLMMKRLRHPCIVRYESLYIDMRKRIAWLVMEHLNYASLEKANIKNEDDMKKIMFQIIETLNYMHRHDFVHRDIKLSNILYDSVNKTIKLVDFGISKRYRKRDALIDMWTITGTLFYRAPQMFGGDGYRQTVDIWAAGILLYKLVNGKTPFESEYHSQTIQNIRSAELTFGLVFDKYSPQLKKFISRLLSRNPEERPEALDCLKDPWLVAFYSRCRGTGKENDKTFTKKAKPTKDKNRIQMSMSLNTDDEYAGLERLENMRSVRSYHYGQNGGQYHCIDEVRAK